jgi:hypothetical protein
MRGNKAAVRRLAQDNLVQTEKFTYGPGLEGATAWGVGRFGVRNFGNMTKACLIEVSQERTKEFTSSFGFVFGGVAVDAKPRFDK